MMVRQCIVAMALMIAPCLAAAQSPGPPMGLVWQGYGLTQWQGETDLGGGGRMSVNRGVLRGEVLYSVPGGLSAGMQVSFGRSDYRFRNLAQAPWGDVTNLQISLPVFFPVGDRARAILVPSVRFAHESGASASDGQSWGVFAGISWQVSPRLRIGPAFGVFSQLGEDDLDVFPALLIDWEITDRWTLSTGSGLGASRGPGLTLSYQVSDALRLSLIGRVESSRFRLDRTGPAQGGVGEDSSTPVVLAMQYDPNPALSLTAYAGAAFNGELRLDSAAGQTLSRQSYDTAPVAGFALRLRF